MYRPLSEAGSTCGCFPRLAATPNSLNHKSIMVHKTNAIRLLDKLGIRYELREYAVDPEDLAAESVAAKIGLPPQQLFKTLVARGDRSGICMAVIPGDAELDLKVLAAASGNRKMQLVPVKELQGLTGYIRGGVTALAAKKDYPVYADEGIKRFDVISISAGVRGLQILLAPADYVAVTRAVIAALAKPERTQ
jgi:Cys-tRNA(Pro)/Cys-tRNA(Cys) deacylase